MGTAEWRIVHWVSEVIWLAPVFWNGRLAWHHWRRWGRIDAWRRRERENGEVQYVTERKVKVGAAKFRQQVWIALSGTSALVPLEWIPADLAWVPSLLTVVTLLLLNLECGRTLRLIDEIDRGIYLFEDDRMHRHADVKET